MDITSALTVTYNARALTALPTDDGGALESRVLFRSDALSALDTDGLTALADFGIGTVIDLRTSSEREMAADLLPDDGSVRLIELEVLGGDMAGMAKRMLASADGERPSEAQMRAALEQIPTLDELYIGILRDGAEKFATVGRAVVDAAGSDRPGVLFHCTAGKDRTGVAAALLLSVAGVTRDAIVADYAVTGENLARGFSAHLLGMIEGMGVPVTPALRVLATESPTSAIESALDWVAEQHGDAAAYLRSGGMTADEITALRRTLRTEHASVSA